MLGGRRDALFGWNILVRNLTVGALFGYSSVNSTLSLNVPSSHALSSGLRTRARVGGRPRRRRDRAQACPGDRAG